MLWHLNHHLFLWRFAFPWLNQSLERESTIGGMFFTWMGTFFVNGTDCNLSTHRVFLFRIFVLFFLVCLLIFHTHCLRWTNPSYLSCFSSTPRVIAVKDIFIFFCLSFFSFFLSFPCPQKQQHIIISRMRLARLLAMQKKKVKKTFKDFVSQHRVMDALRVFSGHIAWRRQERAGWTTITYMNLWNVRHAWKRNPGIKGWEMRLIWVCVFLFRFKS